MLVSVFVSVPLCLCHWCTVKGTALRTGLRTGLRSESLVCGKGDSSEISESLVYGKGHSSKISESLVYGERAQI